MGNLSINKQAAEESMPPLPEDTYDVICVEATEGPAKSNPNNRRVNCKLEVVDGKYKGRTIFEGFNTVHQTESVWKMGHQGLYRMSLAVGLKRPAEDTAELLSIPFKVRLKITENQETGDLQNQVKAYFTQSGQNVNEILKSLKGPRTERAEAGDFSQSSQAGSSSGTVNLPWNQPK